MIGLVDCNNFYVSCERVFQPWLERLPVGVLSNNDGCIIARSNELKALGVAMGTPAFELKPLLRRQPIHLLSSNYELYGDMSGRVQAVLEELTPGVEPYSIDEMFVRLDGLEPAALRRHCHDIHRRVRQFTGIPVGVGVAPTHTLAKLANHAAKKWPEYHGVCVLLPDSPQIDALLSRTAVANVWGVGHRLAKRLTLLGIETALDLARADPSLLRRRFSVTLERTARELRGVACIEMNEADQSRQRIMTSRSFGTPTAQREEVHQALRYFGQRSAEKLRAQNSLARGVYVFLKTNRHRPDLPQYAPGRFIELLRPTADTRDILGAVSQAFHAMYRPRYRFMKAGVMLLDLVDIDQQQLSLLDTRPATASQHSAQLMATLDDLNQAHGAGHDHVRHLNPHCRLALALRSPFATLQHALEGVAGGQGLDRQAPSVRVPHGFQLGLAHGFSLPATQRDGTGAAGFASGHVATTPTPPPPAHPAAV